MNRGHNYRLSRSSFPSSDIPARLNQKTPAKAGVVVRQTETLGHSLFATKDFGVGDIVIEEEASLVLCNSDYAKGFLEHLSSCDSSDAPLDYFCSLSADEIEEIPSIADSIEEIRARINPEAAETALLTHFVSVFKLNGHAINEGGRDAGIFRIASKANHSCSPNVITMCTARNRLRMLAIKPIRAGEPIETCYLSGPSLAWPSHLRRQKLMHDRGFLCQCSRCNSVEGEHDVLDRDIEEAVFILLQNPAIATPQNLKAIIAESSNPNHWTVFYLEAFYLELVQSGLIPKDASLVAMARHIVHWLHSFMFHIHPVACAVMINKLVCMDPPVLIDPEDTEIIPVLDAIHPYLCFLQDDYNNEMQ